MNHKIEIIKQIQESKNGIYIKNIVAVGIPISEKKKILDELVESGNVSYSRLSNLYVWVNVRKTKAENKSESKPMNNENMTSASLRDLLFNEIQDLRAGRSEPNRAKAVAQLADKVIKSAELEMEYKRLKVDIPDLDDTPMLLTHSQSSK